jgi:hypothetical protein
LTIKDLWSSILKRVKEAEKVSLRSLCGSRIGVDISVWIHQILSYDEVVLHLSSQPAYRPHRLIQELERRHNILLKSGIEEKNILYVFDGLGHPMKDIERDK